MLYPVELRVQNTNDRDGRDISDLTEATARAEAPSGPSRLIFRVKSPSDAEISRLWSHSG